MSRLDQINNADSGIPRTNSPYDYHTVKDAVKDVEIARTNSPYDYHTVRDPEVTPTTEDTPNIALSPAPAPLAATLAPTVSTPLLPVHRESNTPQSNPTIKSPIPIKPACLPDCASTLGYNLKRRDEQKHLWYCEHCLIMDEAAGVNDPWGFSSAANSRVQSPFPDGTDASAEAIKERLGEV